jgi:hypothetical protein
VLYVLVVVLEKSKGKITSMGIVLTFGDHTTYQNSKAIMLKISS